MTPTEKAMQAALTGALEGGIVRMLNTTREHLEGKGEQAAPVILSALIKILHDQLVVVLLEDPEGTVEFLTKIVTESVTLAAEEAAEVREEAELSVKQ